MLELTRRALNDISDKPELMRDADYDPFASLVSTVPAYADYRRKLAAATALAVDGKNRVMSISAVRAEIYSPTDATNIAATEKTLDHVKASAAVGRPTSSGRAEGNSKTHAKCPKSPQTGDPDRPQV